MALMERTVERSVLTQSIPTISSPSRIKVRRRLQRLAAGTAPLVARNKRQVAILGIVHDLERQIGGGPPTLRPLTMPLRISTMAWSGSEKSCSTISLFCQYLLQKSTIGKKATYGLVHGQLLGVKSENVHNNFFIMVTRCPSSRISAGILRNADER